MPRVAKEKSPAGSNADWKKPDEERRTPNRVLPTSKFKLHPSNFASALAGQSFYSTQIPVGLWFFEKNRDDGEAFAA